MSNLMIKVDNLKKEYLLGAIGGTTLRDELQRRRAKRKNLEDPTKKIGAKEVNIGERFMALNGVSFEVNKGEAVGIIGHNGAGKSTLLKLITRITAPTEGDIYLNGRVASMLEVGTGFHGELTGRENIYLNGAILGMTKKEIDAKMEKIIDFSEVRQFIDTPVKRYSSGMYVKLAFSVAAHLDSEIMIMDEVLAVGDMAFQNKCLKRMREAAQEEGRTVLYVSHNMNTIRTLCDRCIVMDHGQVIFDGDVEEAISLYLGAEGVDTSDNIDLSEKPRPSNSTNRARMQRITFPKNASCIVSRGEKLEFCLKWQAKDNLQDVKFRMIIRYQNDAAVGLVQSECFGSFVEGSECTNTMLFDTSMLAEGRYYLSIALFQSDESGNSIILDHITRACMIEVMRPADDKKVLNWEHRYWGSVRFPDLENI